MKDITQLVYDEIFVLLLKCTPAVYDYLPPEVGYPFIYVGEQFDQPMETKSNDISIGATQLTIHVYGTHRKRRELTDLIREIKLRLRTTRSNNYSINSINSTITQENPSQAEVLLHGVMTVDFSYYQKERGN